jgi:hypothetical protein
MPTDDLKVLKLKAPNAKLKYLISIDPELIPRPKICCHNPQRVGVLNIEQRRRAEGS